MPVEEVKDAKVSDFETVRNEMGLSVEDFYAIPRDPPSASKLPIYDAVHVRNALARFNQMKDVSREEREKGMKKILAAAKKFGIEVSAEEESKMNAHMEINELITKLESLLKENKSEEALALVAKLSEYLTMMVHEDEPIEKKSVVPPAVPVDEGEHKEMMSVQEIQKQMLDEIDELKKSIFAKDSTIAELTKEKSTYQSTDSRMKELVDMNEKLIMNLKESDSQISIMQKGIESLKSEIDSKSRIISTYEQKEVEEQNRIRSEKVDRVASMYTKFFGMPDTEKTEMFNLMSGYSDDMLDKTQKYLEMKEQARRDVPVPVTQPSEALRNVQEQPKATNKRNVNEDTSFLFRGYVGMGNVK